MLEKLQEIYEEITGDFDTVLTGDMIINEDLSLSSIGKFQLVYAIEEYFNIDIPSNAIREFIKIKDLVKFLNENVK